jgi:hypothetical protein
VEYALVGAKPSGLDVGADQKRRQVSDPLSIEGRRLQHVAIVGAEGRGDRNGDGLAIASQLPSAARSLSGRS